MCPIVASGEKPKALFPITEIMPFKFEYKSYFVCNNFNIDNTELFLTGCFTLPLRHFNQTMLQTFHNDPKESYELEENVHDDPLKLVLCCECGSPGFISL